MPNESAVYPKMEAFGFNMICGYFTKPGRVAYLVEIFLISLATGPNSLIHGPFTVLDSDPFARKSPKTFCIELELPTYDQ